MRHRRGQKKGDGRWEKTRNRVGVAAPDSILLANDLARDVVEAPTEGIDIAAELVALVEIEVEGELLVDLKLVELRLDGGTEVGEDGGNGVDVARCPVGEEALQTIGLLPAARLDSVE